ncbi:hypothetical protein ACTOB_000516 [Actinoplanes oblitus]|uniref:DUF4190 domain-containing protein n=1 Tax=Actinoplanes oblitus TaxID=3040509 RepID=A0ABY8WGL5_9ACTN|nr:hypothetical protein [Actinoplanes oblitus]WIM97026.1 hypothetical protein ACTOB_000516 [Actinoplanes oblitus]
MVTTTPVQESVRKAPVREIVSSFLVLLAGAMLAVNFLVAIPVSLIALAVSTVSAVTAKKSRGLLIFLAVMAGALSVAAILMAFFLVSADTVVIENSVSETNP